MKAIQAFWLVAVGVEDKHSELAFVTYKLTHRG